MKKIIFFILGIAFGLPGFSQKSTWGGYAYQRDQNRVQSSYPMVITIEKSGNNIKGTTYFSFPDDPSVFVKMQYSGFRKNDTMYLKEDKILEATQIQGEWLMKDFILYSVPEEDGYLYGTWKARSNSISNGTMKLKMSKVIEKK
jgi:hypothetical protein